MGCLLIAFSPQGVTAKAAILWSTYTKWILNKVRGLLWVCDARPQHNHHSKSCAHLAGRSSTPLTTPIWHYYFLDSPCRWRLNIIISALGSRLYYNIIAIIYLLTIIYCYCWSSFSKLIILLMYDKWGFLF